MESIIYIYTPRFSGGAMHLDGSSQNSKSPMGGFVKVVTMLIQEIYQIHSKM